MEFDKEMARRWLREGDVPRALLYMKEHADRGSITALITLALYYKTSGNGAASGACIDRCERALTDDNLYGHLELAGAYQTGLGNGDLLDQKNRALELLAVVGEAGNPDIQVSLMLHYLHGLNGAPEDRNRALYWASKAALNGSRRARNVKKSLTEGVGDEKRNVVKMVKRS